VIPSLGGAGLEASSGARGFGGETAAGLMVPIGAGVDPAAQRDFADLLGIARRVRGGGGGGGDGASAAQEAHDTAERFVAATFVQPLLDRFAEMSDAAPPFQRTRAERTFGTLLHGQMALEVVRKGDWAVVDRVASGLLERAAGGAEPPGSGAEAPGGRGR